MAAVGIPAAEARLVEVTAHLRHGAVLPTWFPAPLDGILAAVARDRYLGADRWAHPETPSRAERDADPHGMGKTRDYVRHHRHLPLPLVRVTRQMGKRWVWGATCATWDGDETDLRHIHQRWDDEAGERVVDTLPAATDVGRYKAWRIPLVAVVAPALRWRACGNPEQIIDLLRDVDAVGKHARSGEGVVTRWDVRDLGPADVAAVTWHPDGRIARPFPTRARDHLGVPDAEVVTVDAFRPPYFRPPMTDAGRREPQQVIAPWTERPC